MQKIEENNRMGKTRDLFKKIRDTKGTFCAKMDTIKDRNGMDLQKQKISRRGKKAFFSDQCKEIEENNRMGKIRDLFKKIRDTREHFMQRWAQ